MSSLILALLGLISKTTAAYGNLRALNSKV
jgi:hypothetical protein